MLFYDSWLHNIQLFLTRLFMFAILFSLVGGAIWYWWVVEYFQASFIDSTRLGLTGENLNARILLSMCFVCSFLFTGWLFTVFKLIGSIKNKVDRHHRGAQVIDREN